MAKKWTLAKDEAADRRAGIKEGSARDNALDRKRGVPVKPGAGHSGNARSPKGKGGFPFKAKATKSARANPFKG